MTFLPSECSERSPKITKKSFAAARRGLRVLLTDKFFRERNREVVFEKRILLEMDTNDPGYHWERVNKVRAHARASDRIGTPIFRVLRPVTAGV